MIAYLGAYLIGVGDYSLMEANENVIADEKGEQANLGNDYAGSNEVFHENSVIKPIITMYSIHIWHFHFTTMAI